MPREQRIFTQTLSVPSTASTTTAGSSFALPLKYDAMAVHASLVGLTGGTLDIYLQDSPDGGTTWVDCAHFSQISAAGTVKQSLSLGLSPTVTTVGIGTTAAPGVALAAGTVRPGPWVTSAMRIVAVSGSGTSGNSQTQTIYFIATDYSE